MQVILDTDEGWSLMTLIASQIIDRAGISSEGKDKLRKWRTRHADGTVDMDNLAAVMNESLGTVLDEKTSRLIRRTGHYISSRDRS